MSGRKPEREKAIEAYKEFVRPVIADPIGDDRKLTIRGFREQSGLGNDTIYKYGLNRRIQRVHRWRQRRRGEDAGRAGTKKHQQLQRARTERDDFREKYERLLEKWVTLKAILRDHRDIDVESWVADYPLRPPGRHIGPKKRRSTKKGRR